MTEPTHRERNAMMIAKIRETEPQPCTEGRHVLRVLCVPGRRTGTPREVPLAVTQLDGQRYVCSPSRRRDWTANLLAAGACRIEQDPGRTYRAELVETDIGATVLATYLGNVRPGGANMWPFPKDAPASVIREHLTEVAVIRLIPA
ncbi:nitroreductase family deazaflavin-dependent oxidoreductase [Crossiella sp. CA-258035]|uniref:nitroreductase family deazaflavin-dependent oxidoreductase n=1 Tax=Crossiella sp. CA-258035 TaxID=2981138 RepID=UPI0024BCF60F|nr:nitroreductase family deazaflavin-dependent oxidoreductase [Crossiella sp. CA-258035]WHT16666.1 nitroreductase family deazaflavin-dependent oxidoreductase [Crossiella sp. CA-258035]